MDTSSEDSSGENLIEDALLQSPESSLSSSSSSGFTSEEDPLKLYGSTTSSSDEEELERIKRKKLETFVDVVVHEYSDAEFKNYFRMERNTAYNMIEQLKKSEFIPNHTFGRKKVTAEAAFLMTLNYLGNLETYREIADRFSVSESSVLRTVSRVLNFLVSLKETHISWPTEQEAEEISDEFDELAGIPDVIGAMDVNHIRIKELHREKISYRNKRGYNSIILQAVVDNKKKFREIFCGETGAQCNARAFWKSPLFVKGEELEGPLFYNQYFLLGNNSIPSQTWLVTPFKASDGPLTREQVSFNSKHMSTKMVVDQAFALLKGRFRRLEQFDNLTKQFILKCIVSACVLHNICIDNNDMIQYNVIMETDIIEEDGVVCDNQRLAIFNRMFRS